MDRPDLPPDVCDEITAALRRAGAKFAFLHGSRAKGTATEQSDIDVAAYWEDDAPPSWEVAVPARVDLLVLDDAPLELAGRVALHGQLIFDDDPPLRVRWQALTRTMYFDQEFVQRMADRAFFEGHRGR